MDYRCECNVCCDACSTSRPERADDWADDHERKNPGHKVKVYSEGLI